MQTNFIRNFSIIAHIDHGKSTLADRLLELTGTVEKRKMRAQMLDRMELEREKGITIKLKPVALNYQYKNQKYLLNLIDTPGHTDFNYEVERSLEVCEGAILLVDASQGVQAQTLANFYLAKNLGLKIIPVINKIDLPNADLAKTTVELKKLMDCSDEEILKISAKTGAGVEELLCKIVEQIPAPIFVGTGQRPVPTVIFDSFYDDFFGVVAIVRIWHGEIKKGDQLKIIFGEFETEIKAEEIGVFKPEMQVKNSLQAGEVGYIKTGLKDISRCGAGSIIFNLQDSVGTGHCPIPTRNIPQSLIFSQFYPKNKDDNKKLREALDKLKLNDASLNFEPVHSEVLGFGFNCGFLGVLHMEIIKERLSREFDLDLILTQPIVEYHIFLRNGSQKVARSAQSMPAKSEISRIEEPMAEARIFTPAKFLGPVMELFGKKRGIYKNIEYLTQEQVVLTFEVPLAELISGTLDSLKSVSAGYASLKYQRAGYKESDLVKLEILVHKQVVPAFSRIVPRVSADSTARVLVKKIKSIFPRQMFSLAIQAQADGRIIAREDLSAMSKDVTAKLYGGDRTRKDKLLKKQKKGKKRLSAMGKVDIPSRVFFEVVKM